HQHEQRETDLACVSLDPSPGGSGELAQEHERRPPEQTARRIEEREPAIGDLGHACEPGDHHTKGGCEPPEEDGGTSAAPQVSLRAVEMLVDPVAQEGHAATHAAEDAMSPATA